MTRFFEALTAMLLVAPSITVVEGVWKNMIVALRPSLASAKLTAIRRFVYRKPLFGTS